MWQVVAYIDAGTGSYLLAAIASGAAGTWFFIRSKMGSLGRRKGSSTPANETDATPESTPAER
jgi:hypothetical protein